METRTEKLQRIEISGVVTRMTAVEIGVNNTRTAYMTVSAEDGEYKVMATESGRVPDFDRITPGTVVRVTGRMRMDGQTIAAHNIEIQDKDR